MPQPTPYVPATDFTDYQSAHPGDPSLGTDMDAEFAAIQATTDDILTNLALIQRDDGTLANGVVTSDALGASALALIAAGGTARGAWVTATSYAVGDVVTEASVTYICAVAHTSGTFATDLTAVKWLALTSAGDVVGPSGGATDGLPAVFNGTGGKSLKVATAAAIRASLGVSASDTDIDAIAALTSAANKMPYATGAGTWALADLSSAGRALIDDADAAAQLTTLGVAAMRGVAQAFINFQGTGAPTARGTSLNVSSITDNGTGDYTINFTSVMAGVNYTTILTTSFDSASDRGRAGVLTTGGSGGTAFSSYTTGACRIMVQNVDPTIGPCDQFYIGAAFFGGA